MATTDDEARATVRSCLENAFGNVPGYVNGMASLQEVPCLRCMIQPDIRPVHKIIESLDVDRT